MPPSLLDVLPISNHCLLIRKTVTHRWSPSSTLNPSHDSVLTAISFYSPRQAYRCEEVGGQGRRRWLRCGGKRGGGDACLASVEQEAAAAHRRIRMKRKRCGELKTAARQGKDVFVSVSSSCAIVASSLPWCRRFSSRVPSPPLLPSLSMLSPIPDAASPPCHLLLSPALPPRVAVSYAVGSPHLRARCCCNPQTEYRMGSRSLRHEANAGRSQVANRGARLKGVGQR